MIRVLVVDDSETVRRALCRQLAGCPDIEVIGTAADAYEARELIVREPPDVITLDLQMPGIGGLAFLERIMRHFPLPVVIVSSVSPQQSENALRALGLGAVDVIEKPTTPVALHDLGRRLADSIRAAASARLRPQSRLPLAAGDGQSPFDPADRVVLIGASTGGTRAIEQVLRALPSTGPGILIVQHLPASFMESFATRLSGRSAWQVRVARDGEMAAPGTALVAGGDRHMTLHRVGAGLRVRLRSTAPVHHQRPAVDPLFMSAAEAAGAAAVGVLLTGMGADGAVGLLRLREAGAYTIAESEETCVVFGMPREAARIGAAVDVLPLHHIPAAIDHAVAAGYTR